ncbi:MAG: nuclear transport factor 2 family protein [Flavobacteriaceae bacterium]|nr:nuclear transport factor 2 family protein [Flavobacteriaceae bacterium]
MKKVMLFFMAAFLIWSCKNESRYTTESAEIDLVKSLLADYESGSWEDWKGHYADTAKVYHNSAKSISVSDLQKYHASNLEDLSMYKFQEKDRFFEMVVDDEGDKWVNFWGTWEGTIAANNQTLEIPVHITAQFKGDKIVEEHAFYNLAEMAMAMMALEEAEKEEDLEEIEE